MLFIFTLSFRSTASPMHEEHKNEHSTVIEEQIHFFGNLAKKSWDEKGELKALHTLNKLR